MTILLRSITLAAFTATLWLLYAFPFWKFVPENFLMPVSAHECGSAHGYRVLYESDPELRARILPIVMASRGYRGDESEVSQWSCDQIARTMRDHHAALNVVPQRFLCQSVRRHARELYRDAHHNIGPPLWVIGDHAVGPVDLYETLTAEGIAYTHKGLEVREPPSP